MTYGVPATCTKCGSGRVDKERIRGTQTGDWVCGVCGPPEKPKEDAEKK